MSVPEPDRVAAVAQITTHTPDGVATIMRALRGSPRILALLAAWTKQIQDVEDALWALLTDTIATGVGAQLDQLGRLLLEPRLALDDASYRAVLRATVLARKSRGTAADLCAVLAAMLGGATFTYTEGFGYVLLAPDLPLPFDAGAAVVPLRLAKAAGVRLELLAPFVNATKTLAFAPGLDLLNDGPRGLDNGFGSGGNFVGVRV